MPRLPHSRGTADQAKAERLLQALGAAEKPLALTTHAVAESKRVPRFLRKYAKTDKALRRLSRRVNACSFDEPCGKGACPRCVGMVQAWLAWAGVHFLRQNRELGPWELLSWVLPGQDGSLDLRFKKRWFKQQLQAAGLTTAIGGIDISWNVDKRGRLFPHRTGWTLQLWALIRKNESAPIKRALRMFGKACDEVPRPVSSQPFDGDKRGFEYILKPNFILRETILTPRADTGELGRNTRHDQLTVEMKRELYPALDREGIFSRLILIGCQVRWTSDGPRIRRRRRDPEPETVTSRGEATDGGEMQRKARR